MRHSTTAIALTALLLATPLAAQMDSARQLGSITGTIDLVPASWVVTQDGAGGGSHWRARDAGLGLRLSGRRDGAAWQGRLVVSFTVEGRMGAASADGPRITLSQPTGTGC